MRRKACTRRGLLVTGSTLMILFQKSYLPMKTMDTSTSLRKGRMEFPFDVLTGLRLSKVSPCSTSIQASLERAITCPVTATVADAPTTLTTFLNNRTRRMAYSSIVESRGSKERIFIPRCQPLAIL